jgi:hypothetical protein
MDSDVLLKIKQIVKYENGTLYRIFKGNRLREVKPNVHNTVKFFGEKIFIPKLVWYLNTGYYPENGAFGYKDYNNKNYSFDNLVPLWDTGELTPERIEELFDYNPETGILSRRYSLPGAKAGPLKKNHADGYISVKIFGKSYMAHRLIWMMYYKEDIPDGYVIDHINHIRDDNRIKNLRIVTTAENARNMKSKSSRELPIGVQKTDNNRYKARVDKDGIRYNVGTYDTVKEAEAALKGARIVLGFHRNHGS